MAITTRKITTYAKNIKDLSDTPNKDGMTADDLKAFFDGRGDAEIKASINGIVDDLTAITDGSSGADQIGITPLKVGGSNKAQTAIEELKTDMAADLKAHTDKTDNPHTVTKTQVGLGNVDNTSDINKPISTATQTALDGKVDDGQVLTNVPAGAVFTDTVTTVENVLTSTSTTNALSAKMGKDLNDIVSNMDTRIAQIEYIFRGKNDGTDIADELNTALASYKDIYLPSGNFGISKPIIMGVGARLHSKYGKTTLTALTGFTGNFLIQNWEQTDYAVGETNYTIPPSHTANPNYYPYIEGLRLDLNNISGVSGIGWVHPQERANIGKLIFLNCNYGYAIRIFSNLDSEGSINGNVDIGNIVCYGSYKSEIKISGLGSDVHIHDWTTSPSVTSESVFDFNLIDITMDNIHCEANVNPSLSANTDLAIFRLRDCTGFSLTESLFSNSNSLNHPLIYATNSHGTGYGMTNPCINNLQLVGTMVFNVPFIQDHSQVPNLQDITLSGVSRINSYDGNIYSYLNGATGVGSCKLLNYSTKKEFNYYSLAGLSAGATLTVTDDVLKGRVIKGDWKAGTSYGAAGNDYFNNPQFGRIVLASSFNQSETLYRKDLFTDHAPALFSIASWSQSTGTLVLNVLISCTQIELYFRKIS